MPSTTVTWTQGYRSGGVFTEYGYSDGTTSTDNISYGTLTSGAVSIFNDDAGTTTIKELYTLYHGFVTDYTSLTIAPPSSPTNITQGNLTGTSIMGTPMSGTGNNPSSSFVSTATYDRWLWSQDSASARMVPNSIAATSKSALLTTNIAAADNTPEGFTALAGAVADADLNTQHYATFSGTAAGTTSPGTALALGTTIDNGTSISVSNGQWSTNGTTWNSGASTVNENDSVYFRGLSSASNDTPITHSLTIGTVTRSFTTTTFKDTFPDNYTNLAGNNLDADLSTVYYATFSTTQPGTTSPGTAFNVGTTISDGTSVSVNNGEYRINAGSFTSVAGTIDQNDSIYFRSNATASASGQTLIASLTIGSASHNFQLKTGDVPGNTAGLGIGNETYGVVAFGPDGTTEVWGSNIRQTNIIIKEYFSLANNSSSSFICADANDSSKVILSVGAPYPATGPASRAAQANLSVSATATGFTVSNTESTVSATLAVRVIASRIS